MLYNIIFGPKRLDIISLSPVFPFFLFFERPTFENELATKAFLFLV